MDNRGNGASAVSGSDMKAGRRMEGESPLVPVKAGKEQVAATVFRPDLGQRRCAATCSASEQRCRMPVPPTHLG